MAETTPTTSGTSTQNTSTPGSSGARDTTERNTTDSSATTTSAGSAASTTTSNTSQGQRSPSAGGQQQQRQQAQTSGQETRGQQTRGQQTRGKEPDNKGKRDHDAYHVELTGNAMSDARKVGSDLVSAARDSAVSMLDAQRDRAADQIAAIGEALRQSSEPLESTGVGSLVQYANQAADQVCGFAESVRERSWNELAGDLESFARRSPILFMTSAVALGFIAGRFLLSSSERTAAGARNGGGMSGSRTDQMRRDSSGAGRSISGARAEYGSSGHGE
jgi:hypothetical protein